MRILLVDDELTALRDLERVMNKAVSNALIDKTDDVETAVKLCREKEYDVAFLDISMPEKDGLTLARELKTIRPMLNIVIVTAYPQFALDAIKLYVCDYILKPAMPDDLKRAIANLRNPVTEDRRGLYVRCFGNFEAFYDGKIIHFGRSKVKELFAYLIDRKGSAVSNAELRAILWGDEVNDGDKQRKYFAQLIYEFRAKLDELGISDIFIQSRDSYAIVADIIPCDYYLALKKDMLALSRYEGEYMSQYEWAVNRAGTVEKELKKYK